MYCMRQERSKQLQLDSRNLKGSYTHRAPSVLFTDFTSKLEREIDNADSPIPPNSVNCGYKYFSTE